ncbi:MAG: HD-GYP domain-containing protein, partial [Rhodocyclaceae bacterium]
SDMSAEWMIHPLLSKQLLITDGAQIATIQACGVQEIYIDTGRGLDAPHAPTAAEAAAITENEIRSTAEKPASVAVSTVALAEEFTRARHAYSDATRMVRKIMTDARLGKQLGLCEAQLAVDKIVGSVMRNGSALMVVCRLREQDDYTFRHSVNVSVMLVNQAKTMGAEMDTLREIGLGGLIHDVGKMLVNPAILNKPGRLNDDEFAHMRSHVDHGSALLRQSSGVPKAAMAVLDEHHERYDGTGYPYGLKNEEISVAGRMAALSDVYDAITSDRCYHKGMNPAEAMRRIFEWSKHHFDPSITHAFVRSIGIYPVGSLVRLESGFLAVVIEQRENSLLRPVLRLIFNIRSKHFIVPRDIDLSGPSGTLEQIVSHEDPSVWRIDTGRFIG